MKEREGYYQCPPGLGLLSQPPPLGIPLLATHTPEPIAQPPLLVNPTPVAPSGDPPPHKQPLARETQLRTSPLQTPVSKMLSHLPLNFHNSCFFGTQSRGPSWRHSWLNTTQDAQTLFPVPLWPRHLSRLSSPAQHPGKFGNSTRVLAPDSQGRRRLQEPESQSTPPPPPGSQWSHQPQPSRPPVRRTQLPAPSR